MAKPQPMQVVMCEATARVPPEILHVVRYQLEEISRALAHLEPDTLFWTSLRESGLSLEVLGWKFSFSLEPDKLVLTKTEAVPAHVF